MKVLFVGSAPDSQMPERRETFAPACRELGAALAKQNFEIVIGSAQAGTADGFVLEGAASVEGRPRVLILRPDDLNGVPDGVPAVIDRLDVRYKRVRGSWSAGNVPQILAADAVVLVGGAGYTLSTGYVAPALERPVIAIASFGGAAGKLWPEFQSYYDRLGGLATEVGRLGERWQPGNADLVVRMLQESIRRRLFKAKPRLPIGIYFTLLSACLIGWVILFVNPAANVSYSFFAMLAAAGLLGTILRNNLRLVFDPTANFSWNELMIEMATGLLLGFALALLYLAGALTITGRASFTLSPGSPDGYQRVAVVMTLLGLGGGLMIEQAAERVRRWFSKGLWDTKD
jgi:hypothetical protein